MTAGPSADNNTLPASEDPAPPGLTREAPRGFFPVLAQLGPGMIIAGSIVGAGELITTTKTGAQAGIWLLWLIILGCLVKVFAQIELGRYAIGAGQSTLAALNSVPGPKYIFNWMVWYWVFMLVITMGQLGGIVGGVGQSMAIAFPVTGDYSDAVRRPSEAQLKELVAWEKAGPEARGSEKEIARRERGRNVLLKQLANLGPAGEKLLADARKGTFAKDPWTWDDRIWALGLAIVTSVCLYVGRYGLIQWFSTILVMCFTGVTMFNVIALQQHPDYAISWKEIWNGLAFHLPPAEPGINPLGTALATFGIIGVGASELIAYPYWCLEKGYARHVGVADGTPGWTKRARDWIRIMHLDAFASMVLYTIATIAFFFMGVAVLYRDGRDPDGMRMVSTLSEAYVPIFGDYARWLFLLGAFAVLYSTYLVACAGHARTVVDAMKISNLVDRQRQDVHDWWTQFFSAAFPLISLVIFLIGLNPVSLVLFGAVTQTWMLPMLAGCAVYLRYARTPKEIRGPWWWGVLLIGSTIILAAVAIWEIAGKLSGGQVGE